jgi:hypothetical protein
MGYMLVEPAEDGRPRSTRLYLPFHQFPPLAVVYIRGGILHDL